MSLMFIVSLVIAALAVAISLFAFLIGRTEGSRQAPLPAGLLLATGVYAVVDGLGWLVQMTPDQRQATAGLGIGVGGFFLIGAIRYLARTLGQTKDLTYRVLQGALVVSSIASLLPGVAYTKQVAIRPFPMLQSIYYDTQPTVMGFLIFGIFIGTLIILVGRMTAAWRRGVPQAGYYTAAFGIITITSAVDLLSSLGLTPLPYMLTEGIFLAALTLAAAIMREIARDRLVLRELRDELEKRVAVRTRELEDRTKELARSERHAVVGRLAAGIAHELNNPAAAIKASLDDARSEIVRRGSSAEVLACIDISIAAVERVTRIVRQLGAMAGGAEAGGASAPSTSLAKAVRGAMVAARDQQRPDVELVADVPSALWVRGVGAAVEEAITALVLNAVQAIPDGRSGRVVVTAHAEVGTVQVQVRDNGDGMREETASRAFEPFFTTKELGRSSGLGLPVAKGLVETMGGALALKSIVGVGTEATIQFVEGSEPEISSPKARPLDTVIGAARPSEGRPEIQRATAPTMPVPVVPEGNAPKPRLLLLDDDDLVRTAMRRYLGKYFEVDTAGSVEQALAMADASYDIFLSDVVMPDGGGQRFYLELLRREPPLADRLIFMTGGAFRGELQEFLREQSQPVLNKPVRYSELAAAVARIRSTQT